MTAATKGDACQSKKVKSSPDISLSSPRFQNEADCFARDMAQYSAETIADMLGCSLQIAAQNRMRFMRFFEDAPKLPAILAYQGQAYKHLKAETLNVDNLNYSQRKLWITSLPSVTKDLSTNLNLENPTFLILLCNKEHE